MFLMQGRCRSCFQMRPGGFPPSVIPTTSLYLQTYKTSMIIGRTQALFTRCVRKPSCSCTILTQLARANISSHSITANRLSTDPSLLRRGGGPPVGSPHPMPGAQSASQLITELLMECFPSGGGSSQRGMQSVLFVKLL